MHTTREIGSIWAGRMWAGRTHRARLMDEADYREEVEDLDLIWALRDSLPERAKRVLALPAEEASRVYNIKLERIHQIRETELGKLFERLESIKLSAWRGEKGAWHRFVRSGRERRRSPRRHGTARRIRAAGRSPDDPHLPDDPPPEPDPLTQRASLPALFGGRR